MRRVVLPLALLEGHQIDPLGLDGAEPLDGGDELLTHGGRPASWTGTRTPSCVFRK